MRLRLRSDRLLLGFRGLGLLRGWPFQDPKEADTQIQAIEGIISSSREDRSFEMDVPDVGEAFSAWSAVYDPSANPLIAVEQPVVRGLLHDIAPGRALDLASGTGRLSKVLHELGHDVVALDGSLEMLGRARLGLSRARLIRGDLHALPLRGASFDVIVCGLSLTHAEDLARPVGEIARVIRPGGTVVISDIHPLAVATGAHAFFQREDGTSAVIRNHVHWPSQYVEAFRAAGLRIDRLLEPTYDRTLLDEVADDNLRSALEVGVVGLPFVLVWLLRLPSDG